MNQYVVILSIGPVQGFISAARRSRDLWSGSWLLSELSKACAKNLYKNASVELIFPHIEQSEQLEQNSNFSVGNKIQALIKAQGLDELEQIIQQAKKTTQQRFLDEANVVLGKLAGDDIRSGIWESQLNDYVEIQSAWAKIDITQTDGYHQATILATKALAARKATRDFNQPVAKAYQSEFMLPKSSLDGMRETVLNENLENTDKSKRKKLKDITRRKLNLSDSEQLDCAGVVKRLGFDDKAEQFTPITRVAADAWIQEAFDAETLRKTPQLQANFSKILECYEKLIKDDAATRVKGNNNIYKLFPYDAQYLYLSRLDADIRYYKGRDDAIGDTLIALKEQLRPFWKQYGQPYTYGVLLQADGDRMGELLDKATTLEAHQAVTKALSAFAGQVSNTMRDYQGHCIYAGGDDVLGFVPLNQAYLCAKKLSELFKDELQTVTQQLGAKPTPTLSVGIAICHIMTPLGVVRELAAQSEKYAKGDHVLAKDSNNPQPHEIRRNALALLLSVRGGSDIQLRMSWDDHAAHTAFNQWIESYKNKAIPSRIAYDMRDIFLHTRLIGKENMDLQKDIRLAELERMLKKSRTNQGLEIPKHIIKYLTDRAKSIGLDKLDKLADELIVARWLAAKTQQELGKE